MNQLTKRNKRNNREAEEYVFKLPLTKMNVF